MPALITDFVLVIATGTFLYVRAEGVRYFATWSWFRRRPQAVHSQTRDGAWRIVWAVLVWASAAGAVVCFFESVGA